MATTERKLSDSDSAAKWRNALPASMVSKSEISIWSILKKCMKKDLTRISIPVAFNEPLSLLQRLAECMEYEELLHKAHECLDCIERFENVAAFVISSLSSNYMRLSKPFNPLWFETYELDRIKENGYRFIAEQVSHLPPISAFHCESEIYLLDAVVSPCLKFRGTSIEVQPSGNFHLKLLSHNEIYTWNTLNVIVHNVIMGQMYIELEGQLYIQCSNGLDCKLSFKNNDSGTSRRSTFFQGSISKFNETLRAVYGNWTTFLATCEIDNFEQRYIDWLEMGKQDYQNHLHQKDIPLLQGSRLIWKSRPRPRNSPAMYNFTSFALLLNDPSGITDVLPPTDSRLRPDIRLLEMGHTEAAEKEKERLEIKQREARALMRTTQEKSPKWFTKQHTNSKDNLLWIFTDKYWSREFGECEDIY